MKRFLHFLNVSLLVVMAAYLTAGCKKDTTTTPEEEGGGDPVVEASLSAELKTSTATTAEITLTTTKIAEAAYIVASKEDATPDAAVVFAMGTREIACTDGENTVTIRNLDPLTDYVIYLAGITDTEEYCEDIAAVEVSTSDFEDEIAIYNVDYNGFNVRMKVPDNLATSGNVIKWGLCDLATYKMNAAYCDAERLNLSDENYKNYVSESTTFTFDNDFLNVRDEQGNPVLDETGTPFYYYDPIVPGGKYVIMFGEFAWGEHPWGFGEGYYTPLCDVDKYYSDQWVNPDVKEADYWTGFYHNIQTSTKAPESLDASLNITTALRPNGGVISFTPDEKVKIYCYVILDDALYNQVLSMVLDNDPNNMQWYLTTLNAMYTIYAMSAEGPTDVTLEDLVYVDKETTYHIFAVGMGDENGTTQCFEHKTFTLPDPTKPAPVVSVTPITNPNGEESPYEVWFNVKCTSKDAFTGMYACNYQREWESALSGGYYTEADLIERGYELSKAEIGEMNSDAGLNISFSSREDAVTYLGVLVYNDEGTASEPAVAQNRTIREPAAEPVTSELFTDLLGDWTASATVQYQEYNSETLSYETKTTTLTSKVTIGDVGYETTLPDAVYQYYYNNTDYTTKEQVDAVYAEFKAAVDVFNEKTHNQNRLLCQGLDLEIQTAYSHNTEYASPYDLFISETYSGFDSESPVYDFGPKWYLQIAADGSVTVPFNNNLFAPLSAWKQYEYYLVGVSETAALPYVTNSSNEPETGHFPVTVSEDKNTLTVNPLTYNNETYYAGVGYLSYGYYQFPSRIISPITLTRGWSGETETKTRALASYMRARQIADPIGMMSQYEVKTVNKPKSRTVIPTAPTVERKQIKAHIPTVEEFENNIKTLIQKKYGKR